MTLSALFSVNGSTTVQAHPANYDATVTFVIQSLTGIETIAWSVVGTSKSDQAALAVSLSGTPSGATATVTMPSDPGDGLGRAFRMKLLVSNAHESAVHYAVFGAANVAGIIPAVVGEETDRSATHGTTDVFNAALAAVGLQLGSADDVGDAPQWNGSIWVPRRGWITPDVDLTGTVDATAALQSTFAAAAARPGSCVYLPEGDYKVGTGAFSAADLFTVGTGVTVTGPERGLRRSSRLFASGTPGGARFLMHSTGKLFTPAWHSALRSFEVYYPNQETDAAPDTYDWTIHADGTSGNGYGCTFENLTLLNPHKGIYLNCNGATLSDIYGFPLLYGVHMARCADVIRIHNLHFNYNASPSDFGSTLLAWVLANGSALVVDGAEDLKVSDSFVLGYKDGVLVQDLDADAFHGAYGSFSSFGIDSCANCVRINSDAIHAHGLSFTGGSWAPATAGYGLRAEDNYTPASAYYRLGAYLTDVRIGGGSTYDRGIWCATDSNAIIRMAGGMIQNYSGFGARTSGADAIVLLDGVRQPSGGTRVSGTGASEVNAITM